MPVSTHNRKRRFVWYAPGPVSAGIINNNVVIGMPEVQEHLVLWHCGRRHVAIHRLHDGRVGLHSEIGEITWPHRLAMLNAVGRSLDVSAYCELKYKPYNY